MARLKEEHKELIVRELATYNKPSDIQKRLKSDHGIEVTLPQINHYNPEGANGLKLAEKWKELFAHVRDEYKDEVSSHAIASKAFRLGAYQKMLDKHLGKNDVLALQILEQVAKEVGGVFERVEPENVVSSSTVYQQFNTYINQKLEVLEGGRK